MTKVRQRKFEHNFACFLLKLMFQNLNFSVMPLALEMIYELKIEIVCREEYRIALDMKESKAQVQMT